MNSILIVEDAPEIQFLLKKTLGSPSCELVLASTAHEALQALAERTFSLVLLDIGLPDQSGLQLCSELQTDHRTKDIPIFFLSGFDEVSQKISAFSLGAEDYIVKPFDPLELKARIEARLRKAAVRTDEQRSLRRGPFLLDSSTQRVSWNAGGTDREQKKAIHFTPIEFKLLFHLARTPDVIFSREQLLDAIWGNNKEVFDRTVDTHISSIRRKLGPLAAHIESIPGSGYRFLETPHTRATKKSA